MARAQSSQRRSSGLLLYRRGSAGALEVFLAHPGGPFFAKKDAGAWTLPKGEPDPGEEDLLYVAKREFCEETGLSAPAGPYVPLGTVKQAGGKVVHAWACPGEADPARVSSNTVMIEWPPRSGNRMQIPEIDRCEWFDLSAAREKINRAQVDFLDRLSQIVSEENISDQFM
jgi:predicted NUDIX family NTP pyrophosphohydrolase